MKEHNQQNPAPHGSLIRRAALFALFAVCLVSIVLFSVPGLIPFSDETAGKLTSETVPRLAVALFVGALLCAEGQRSVLLPGRPSAGELLWLLPCLLVALANFPYSALIGGSAVIERSDLVPLFLLKCLSVAAMEELFFRALLIPVVRDRIKGKYAVLWTALLTAALFGLVHLVNLFYGGGVGATFLQVGYTFLLGCMFAVIFMKTGNVWFCMAIHFIFDVGGLIVTDLGSGVFQDTVFWVLTAVCGVLCAVHILLTVIKMTKNRRE